MGAGQSTSQAHPPSQALHVLRVTPHSPASQTDIEPYFDFVVGFEGDALEAHASIDAAKLESIVEAHEGRVLNLLVWSSKRHDTRVVPVTPSRKWSQKAAAPQGAKPSLLGLSMRMCEPEATMDNVWHVLDVIEGSPAESAGLVPMGDWVLGWSGGVLGQENDFYELVEAHVDKPLRVYVYSHDFDALREVVLVPNRHWGGDGLLGCVFGFGLLHRIPPQPAGRRPGSTPLELQDEYDDALFIPADADNMYEQEHPQEADDSAYEREQEQVVDWRQRQQEHWYPDGGSRGSDHGHAVHSHSHDAIQEVDEDEHLQ
ncbi:GRASP55/65 PDZ-like domain-containing protein [Schizophyllum amplum]|uniref:GRASP55/65 PDZ-like domain-containing protein n=1 Tax=Schizophyllum amplum TaxID=97359 RepID=A0A550CBS7_9AGAR|nr:GRASP55/65 PDZ-like domain-containing protein [Auriculariopsis ampla]